MMRQYMCVYVCVLRGLGGRVRTAPEVLGKLIASDDFDKEHDHDYDDECV